MGEFMQVPLQANEHVCGRQHRAHAVRMPDGCAQYDESTLGLVCISTPHACEAWGGWPSNTVVHAGFAKIGGNASSCFKKSGNEVECLARRGGVLGAGLKPTQVV